MDTDHVVEISFTDGTRCPITYMTSTEIRCETEPFETSLRRRDRRRQLVTTGLTVSINGVASDEFTGLELADTDIIVDSITPSSASPILVETLLIQLSSTYDNTDMDTDTFTVSIYP